MTKSIQAWWKRFNMTETMERQQKSFDMGWRLMKKIFGIEVNRRCS